MPQFSAVDLQLIWDQIEKIHLQASGPSPTRLYPQPIGPNAEANPYLFAPNRSARDTPPDPYILDPYVPDPYLPDHDPHTVS